MYQLSRLEYIVKKNIEDILIKIFTISISIILIVWSFYFFIRQRDMPYSLAFWFILGTCIFLNIITFVPKWIIGMEIIDMELKTALHYHSTFTNIVLGFSTVVGIGITLIWTTPGDVWKQNVYWRLAILLLYFILVIYFVFLRELIRQIAKEKNYK